MTTRIRIAEGGDADLATPEPGIRGPGLVICHEWYGLVDNVRTICDRFAAEGFVTLAPDLYRGEVAHTDEEAAKLMEGLSTRRAMEDVFAAVRTLRASPQVQGEIGVLGFCMGGAMAFSAAVAVDGIACAVPFYGIPIAAYWEPTKVRVPVQAHFAKNDGWADPARAAQFQKDVSAAGGSMELHIYDAGHAFMREGDDATYHAPSAELAWERTLEFLRKHLSA